MKVAYNDARSIKAIIETLAKLVDEAIFKFKPEGIELEALERAHIAFIKLSLPKEMFNEYEIQEEFNFGFNTQYLLKIFKGIKRKEGIIIESESPELVSLQVLGSVNRVYKIKNLDVLPPEIPSFNLEFEVTASITSNGFKKAIQQITSVSDSVNFSISEDALILRSEGENKVEVEFSKENGSLQSIEFTKPVSVSYAGDYLNDILSLTKLSDYVNVSFSENKPLQLEFNMEGGGKVNYIQAPKVVQ
ncbi:MAG: proliferating cell nuclear antigen (pcna) [Sulfolobaceae archaeon]